MYYVKLRYIFEDILYGLRNYFLNLFKGSPAKYRISFVEREKESHKLIKERIMESDITDVNSLNRKYSLIINAFWQKTDKDIPKNPDTNYYLEISEAGKKNKKIAFATVLRHT